MTLEKKRRKYRAVLTVLLPLIMLFSLAANGAALGEAGHTVRRVQARLAEMGYYGGRADGLYSPELTNAVRAFQSEKGLPDSGKADSATLSALFDSALPEDCAQLLLARYIAIKCAGKPYWEQVECGAGLMERLKNAGDPDTLAQLLLREVGAAKLLKATPDSTAKQAAYQVCANWS